MFMTRSISFQLIRFNPIGRDPEGGKNLQLERFQLIRFNPIGRGDEEGILVYQAIVSN